MPPLQTFSYLIHPFATRNQKNTKIRLKLLKDICHLKIPIEGKCAYKQYMLIGENFAHKNAPEIVRILRLWLRPSNKELNAAQSHFAIGVSIYLTRFPRYHLCDIFFSNFAFWRSYLQLNRCFFLLYHPHSQQTDVIFLVNDVDTSSWRRPTTMIASFPYYSEVLSSIRPSHFNIGR